MRKLRYGDLAAAVTLGVAARCWILFRTPLVPGINGAYYLVQARSLLEKRRLGIPDLPLTFMLQAVIARGLQWLAGAPLDRAVLWATKLTDAVIPPLAAIPIYFMIRGWTVTRVQSKAGPSRGGSRENNGRVRWIAAAAAAMIAFGAPTLSMVGEFQKNSLALVWLSGFIGASGQCLSCEDPARRRAWGASALGLLTLTGLTHVGVFGFGLVLAFAIVAAHLLIRGGVGQLRVALSGTAAAIWLGLVLGMVTWRFDPARVRRLVQAVSDPEQFVSAGNPMGPLTARVVPLAIIGGISALAIMVAWRRRRQAPGDAAIVMGSAATVIALMGPWFSVAVLIRFMLIAVIPAVVAWAYVLVHLRRRSVLAVGAAMSLVMLIGGIPQILRGGQPIISVAASHELQAVGDTLRIQLPESERTLVVAAHGLEWWSAWFLHTHIAQAQALRAQDWQVFECVLFLEMKHGLQFPGLPMMSAPIPADAAVVYEGQFLRLARVRTPPAFVTERRR